MIPEPFVSAIVGTRSLKGEGKNGSLEQQRLVRSPHTSQNMKRDMDLIRAIMLHLEKHPEPDLNLEEVVLDDYADDVVLGHLILLEEAGFIQMNIERYGGGEPPQILIHRITWAGHEFLEAVRDETIWAKSTKAIVSAGVGFGLPILMAVLRAKASEHLGIPL